MVIPPTQTHTRSRFKSRIIIIAFFLLNSWNLHILPHPGYEFSLRELPPFPEICSRSHSCGYFPWGLCNTVSLSDQLSDICIKPPNTWKTSVSNSVNKARHKKREKNKSYIVNVWFTAPPMKLHRQFHYFNLPATHSSLFLWLEIKISV